MKMFLGYWNPVTRKWIPKIGIGVMDHGTVLLAYSFTWNMFQSSRVLL